MNNKYLKISTFHYHKMCSYRTENANKLGIQDRMGNSLDLGRVLNQFLMNILNIYQDLLNNQYNCHQYMEHNLLTITHNHFHMKYN